MKFGCIGLPFTIQCPCVHTGWGMDTGGQKVRAEFTLRNVVLQCTLCKGLTDLVMSLGGGNLGK